MLLINSTKSALHPSAISKGAVIYSDEFTNIAKNISVAKQPAAQTALNAARIVAFVTSVSFPIT